MEPSADQVFNSTNNITFTCNATDEGQVLNLTLYHNLNGTFSANQSQNYGELPYDSNTTFLCRFNGNLACQAGGSGNPIASESLNFQQGKFSQGVRINETGILRYQTSGNFDRNQGTIEFWIRPGGSMDTGTFYIFHAADSGSQGANEFSIYVSSGTLYFEVYDFSGLNSWDYSTISWQADAWYHIAAVWDIYGDAGNGNPLNLYVNGSNVESYFEGDPTIPCTYRPSLFSIGSDKANSSQINATIDDFRISNRVRNSSEINQSYYDGLGNYSSVSKSWNFLNVTDGFYLWSCLAYDNGSQSNQSPQRSFYVDISTPPSVNGISLSPNSSDDIDPGVTINVTANITDPSGVSTVIFQWKEAGEGNWNNITMNYNSSSGFFENASFYTSIMEGDYYFRIWSNDSKGNAGYSPIQNVTSEWDYTWTRSPAAFGTVSGMITTTGNVGILTINNTGDRTLNFTISDNWPLYYNGSENQNFYVANHTAITINITAQFASSDSENDVLITTNASHYLNITSPVSLTTNATINSYTGGPYLTVSIMEYTGMVSQSQSFNLSAKVKNIGNETAENVWLNWTLPSGWSNISGNVMYFVGNMNSGSFVLSNLTVTVNPSSASPGTFMIYANSSCEQNISGYDSKIIGVSCSNSDGVCGYGCSYVNDNNCGIPSGPGGTAGTAYIGGGGGGEEIKYIMSMEAPPWFDIQRGDKKTVRVKIANEGVRTNLTSIYLSITGYPLTHIRITPLLISTLGYNQTGWFELDFFAPNYTEYGIHNITMVARTLGSTDTSKNFTDVQKTVTVSMVVHSVHENETKNALAEAEKAVREMADAGLSTGKAKSLLEEAKSQISSWNYDTSLETSKSILELRDKSFHITGMIDQIEEGIKEAEGYGIQAPESRKMAELSKSALQREDYAKAEERVSSAVSAFMIEGQWLETMRFIYANWQFIIAGSAVFAGAVYLAYRKPLKGRIRKRIALLSMEEKAIRKLMEKAQEDMYREKTLSKLEYHKLMADYETSLAKIRKRKSELTGRLIRLEKRPLPEFRKQEESLRSEIQDIQKKYYEQGSVTKPSYQKSMGELREELAESIKNIDMILERRKGDRRRTTERRCQETPSGTMSPSIESRKKGQVGFLVLGILLILCVIFATLVAGQVDDRQAALNAMTNAEGWIKDMQQLGFPAGRVNDTLNEAKLLFSKGFYKGAESLANDVESLKNRAISIDSKIDGVETSIYQAKSIGINVSQPQALFDEALAAFRIEDYGRSEDLLSQASSSLEELESDYSMKRVAEGRGLEGLLKKIQDNILPILIIVSVLTATGIAAVKARRKRKIRRRIKSLEAKAGKLNSMMKELQLKYFEKGSISESEYRTLMERYRKRLAGTKRKKLVLEGLLNKKEKSRPKNS